MTPIRLGIVRPDRPAAVVAIAEARVLSRELERRLGSVVLDLRVHGDQIGPWAPLANAAWPADIDAQIDPELIWSTGVPPLTTLFGRTVEPAAAEVRRRMLAHLGLLPSVVDEQTVEELSSLPMRPTDLWLIVAAAERVEIDDPAIRSFGTTAGDPDQTELDAAFDAIAGPLVDLEPTGSALQESVAAEQVWRRRAAELADELARSEAEAARRLDELAGQASVLRERIRRLELDADSAP